MKKRIKKENSKDDYFGLVFLVLAGIGMMMLGGGDNAIFDVGCGMWFIGLIVAVAYHIKQKKRKWGMFLLTRAWFEDFELFKETETVEDKLFLVFF